MKIITKYQSDDGREFNKKNDCLMHENNCLVAASIMEELEPRPSCSDFRNGEGYIKQDCTKVLEVRNQFLELSKRYTDSDSIQGVINGTTHISHADRILCEELPSSINSHWYRFMCIDSYGREWGQIYFANNPGEGTDKRLNNG